MYSTTITKFRVCLLRYNALLSAGFSINRGWLAELARISEINTPKEWVITGCLAWVVHETAAMLIAQEPSRNFFGKPNWTMAPLQVSYRGGRSFLTARYNEIAVDGPAGDFCHFSCLPVYMIPCVLFFFTSESPLPLIGG